MRKMPEDENEIWNVKKVFFWVNRSENRINH